MPDPYNRKGLYMKYTFIDLFSGAGGFTEGFLLAGTKEADFQLVAASDIHKNAELTHLGRFEKQLGLTYSFIKTDIRNIGFAKQLKRTAKNICSRESVDVVCGGPPCQGFSVWGKRNENDPRNDLFRHYLNAIKAVSPSYFVMENVPGLVTMYDGRIPGLIHEEVETLFAGEYKINGPIFVNSVDYGVPQLRERVLFIGSKKGYPEISHIPPTVTEQNRVTVKEAIGDLEFLQPGEIAYEYNKNFPAVTSYQKQSRNGRLLKKHGISLEHAVLRNHEAAKHTLPVIARFALIQKGKGFESIPENLWKLVSTKKKWCVKLNDAFPSNTMTTLPDDFIHYQVPRSITVREMARLQSFDDTFFFEGPRTTGGGGAGNKKRTMELPQYTQVGNAVPPLMARAVGQRIIESLEIHRLNILQEKNETIRLLSRAV